MKTTKVILEVLIKVTLVVIVFYFLYTRLAPDLKTYTIDWPELIRYPELWLTAFLLVPVNWWFEARKWHYLINKIEPISMWKSYKVILMGMVVGMVTPASVGDLTIRYMNISRENRKHVPGVVGISRLAQLLVTVSFGMTGLGLFLFDPSSATSSGNLVNWQYFFILSLSVPVSFLVFFNLKKLFSIFKIQRVKPYLDVFDVYSRKELTHVLILSTFRYVVFLSQSVLFLWLFNVALPLNILVTGVMVVFFLKSLIPFISFFGGIGFREVFAVWIFSRFGDYNTEVILSSLGVWVFNILVPCIVGLGIFLSSRHIK